MQHGQTAQRVRVRGASHGWSDHTSRRTCHMPHAAQLRDRSAGKAEDDAVANGALYLEYFPLTALHAHALHSQAAGGEDLAADLGDLASLGFANMLSPVGCAAQT